MSGHEVTVRWRFPHGSQRQAHIQGGRVLKVLTMSKGHLGKLKDKGRDKALGGASSLFDTPMASSQRLTYRVQQK